MTLEDDIELIILKHRFIKYTEIVSSISSVTKTEEYIIKALKNLINDGKIFQLKGGAYTTFT